MSLTTKADPARCRAIQERIDRPSNLVARFDHDASSLSAEISLQSQRLEQAHIDLGNAFPQSDRDRVLHRIQELEEQRRRLEEQFERVRALLQHHELELANWETEYRAEGYG